MERIVGVVRPRQIIMFGSGARRQMGPHSDLDLLVVTEGPVHRRALAAEIHKRLGDIPYPVDIVVATPEDLLRYGKSHALVFAPALRDGRVIYDSGALSAG